MCAANDLHEKIAAYYDTGAADPHHRYRSWEHCYRFFRARPRETLLADKDTAALHLAFYLASWGMLRGSTFLLQKAYTAHTGVVERLLSREFAVCGNKRSVPPGQMKPCSRGSWASSML